MMGVWEITEKWEYEEKRKKKKRDKKRGHGVPCLYEKRNREWCV
jgi:hypothetical protein